MPGRRASADTPSWPASTCWPSSTGSCRNWIDRDLTRRIVDRYEQLTGRNLDRTRIELLSGLLRLSELAALPDGHRYAEMALRAVMDWAGTGGA